MRVVLAVLLLLVAAVHAADFLAKSKWESENLASYDKPFCHTGAIKGEREMGPDAGKFSGSNSFLRANSETETWIKGLFDKALSITKKSALATGAKFSWCELFHAHLYRHKHSLDWVFIFHTREYCTYHASELATCKTKYPADKCVIADKSGFEYGMTVVGGLEALAQVGGCSSGSDACSGGFDKHLIVYSSKDQKIYYWKDLASLLDAAKTVDMTTAELMENQIMVGAWYGPELWGNKKGDWERFPDVNRVPSSGDIWFDGTLSQAQALIKECNDHTAMLHQMNQMNQSNQRQAKKKKGKLF